MRRWPRLGTITAAAVSVALFGTGQAANAMARPVMSSTGKVCTIVGTSGNDRLSGTPRADVICGLGGNDILTGASDNDVLDGGPGRDTLTGGAGDDILTGGTGDDLLSGNAGNDAIQGQDGNDTISGGDGADRASGGDGNDLLSGSAGDDVMDGDTGNDTLTGATGSDALSGGTGHDSLAGGPGDDRLSGGDGVDRISAGVGADTATGGPGNDTVAGDDGDDALDGGDGNDTIRGGAGDDQVDGQAGDDGLDGGLGADLVIGEDGTDRADGGDGPDSIDGGAGDDVVSGGDGDDTLHGGEGADTELGGNGADTIVGDDGTDTINGGNGDDVANGGDGDDILNGDNNDDDLSGGPGDDTLDGGPGDDHLDGGTGINTCIGDDADSSEIDLCTDRQTPDIDIASLAWASATTVDNSVENSVRLRLRVSDDRSGMEYVYVKLRSPDPGVDPILIGFGWPHLISGTSTDGLWEAAGVLPAHSPAGSWSLAEVYAQDRVGSYTRFDVADDGTYSMLRVFPYTAPVYGSLHIEPLVVTGTGDGAAPTADVGSARWTSGTTFDSSTDQPIALQIRLTDDVAGVVDGSATLTTGDVQIPLRDFRRESGTPTDGIYSVTGTLPAHTPAGTWPDVELTVRDNVGHVSTARLPGLEAIVVMGVSDLAAPTADLSFGRYVGGDSADNSADRVVTLQVRVADDVSGVDHVFADFRTAGDGSDAENRLDPVGLPSADGVWQLSGTLRKGSHLGTWRVFQLFVTDKVGRQRVYHFNADGTFTTWDGLISGAGSYPTFTMRSPARPE